MADAYEFARFVRLYGRVIDLLGALSGDIAGPSGVEWQTIAEAAAGDLRKMAEMLDAARAGHVSGGPVVFPGIDDIERAGCQVRNMVLEGGAS